MRSQPDLHDTFDEMKDEVLYTRDALRADPDAAGFLPLTDNWLAKLDEAPVGDRKVREESANVDAARVVANGQLDDGCSASSATTSSWRSATIARRRA